MNRKSSLPVLCGGFRSVAINTKDARCTKRGSSYEGNGPSIEQHIPSIGNCKRRGGFGGRVQSLTFFVKGGFHGCCLRGFLDVPGPPLGLKALLLQTAFTRPSKGRSSTLTLGRASLRCASRAPGSRPGVYQGGSVRGDARFCWSMFLSAGS